MEKTESSTTLRLCSLAVIAGLIYESQGRSFLDPTLQINLAVCLVILAGVGLRRYWAGAVAFVALKCVTRLYLDPARGYRYDMMPLLLMLAFAAAEILPKAIPALRRPSEEERTDLVYLVLGLFYLEAALHKLAHPSLWLTGAMIHDLLEYRDVLARAAITRVRDVPGFALMLSLLTLAFEGGFLVTFFARAARLPLLLTAFSFHLGCYYLFGVNFFAYYVPVLSALLFLELQRLRAPASRAWASPDAPAPPAR